MRRADFTVGWICALPHELAVSRAMLDERYERVEDGVNSADKNTYIWGRIGEHQVVMTCLPSGRYGNISAATVARDMLRSFTSIRIGLTVGIAGGVALQHNDIRLGDVVVSKPTETFGGVVQYDFGKREPNGRFRRRGQLNKPPTVLLGAISTLQAIHEVEGPRMLARLERMSREFPRLSQEYAHPGPDKDHACVTDCEHKDPMCGQCGPHQILERHPRKNGTEPQIHYGLIASGESVIASAQERQRLFKEGDVLCFETEAAGLMDSFPCLVIRGIGNYADAHKRDEWQRYAASVAAAYAWELLSVMSASTVNSTLQAVPSVGQSRRDSSPPLSGSQEEPRQGTELRVSTAATA